MARKELRNCTFNVLDGLAGTGALNAMAGAMAGAVTFPVDLVGLNSIIPDQIPVGARFTIAGETLATTVHVVTARTPTSGTTTSITFSPALGPGTYMDEAALTFQPQQISIKIGEGDVKW